MFNPPQTLEEARVYRYGQWIGNPTGMTYIEGKCAAEPYDNISLLFHQCSRKNGEGPAGLYCWQHAKILEKEN